MKSFNANHDIFIQITEDGWIYLNKTVGHDYIENCIKNRAKIINGQTYYRLQCWRAFDIMPPDFGGPARFKPIFLIEDCHLKEFEL